MPRTKVVAPQKPLEDIRAPLPAAPSPDGPHLPHQDQAQIAERLLAMHEMMIQGTTGMDLIALAQDRWGISRRTAYHYLALLKRRLSNIVHGVDFALVHELSQAQRSRMIETVFRLLRRFHGNPELGQARDLAALVAIAGKLIDDRERCARQAVQLVRSPSDPRGPASRSKTGTNRRTPSATVEVTLAPMASPPIPFPPKEIRPEFLARPCPATLAKPALDEKSLHPEERPVE